MLEGLKIREVKVEITGCSDPNYWYKNKIGTQFVTRKNLVNGFYVVKNLYLYGGKDYYGLIKKEDCKII